MFFIFLGAFFKTIGGLPSCVRHFCSNLRCPLLSPPYIVYSNENFGISTGSACLKRRY